METRKSIVLYAGGFHLKEAAQVVLYNGADIANGDCTGYVADGQSNIAWPSIYTVHPSSYITVD